MVPAQSHVVHHALEGLDLRGPLRQIPLDQLVLADWLAELEPPLRPVNRQLHRPLRQPNEYDPMMSRPLSSVCIAIANPHPISPRTWLAGTRQSSKCTSHWMMGPPAIPGWIFPTLRPGVLRSPRNAVAPPFDPFSEPVIAKPVK